MGTGLLTNFSSFTCFKYKTGLIKTLVDRVTKINITSKGLDDDLKQNKLILQKYDFPAKIIDRYTKQFP